MINLILTTIVPALFCLSIGYVFGKYRGGPTNVEVMNESIIYHNLLEIVSMSVHEEVSQDVEERIARRVSDEVENTDRLPDGVEVAVLTETE